ncbi:ABC transporter ATP-binding protein [Eupransor demetentiae]|uniref:ATPase component (FepC) n=1 Tax=Eupransor demetentiae TaxID=3109584 RepID=A0ABM9N599_9LACO|nr:ABC-type cobalamin/Fe3+-siderophores transport system [Lactobacillaceae bacterium LMG 33000]
MTIKVSDLRLKKGSVEILKKISCEFGDGELSCIIGRNGSGKSMLLKSLLDLEKSAGKIGFSTEERLAYIPQKMPQDQQLTVFEFVLLGLYGQLGWHVSSEQRNWVNSVLEDLDLLGLAERKMMALSGGQQQLVVLAQALVRRPTVIIADEPTSALDLNKQLEYLRILRDYIHRHGIVGIIVIHDLTLTARFADRVYLMEKGKMLASGTPGEVLEKKRLEKLYQVDIELLESSDRHLVVVPVEAKGEE